MRTPRHPHTAPAVRAEAARDRLKPVRPSQTAPQRFGLPNQLITSAPQAADARFCLARPPHRRQLVSAVEYCHKNNVAHRDLKLDNTLLDEHDPAWLKLCDFGFAKHWQVRGWELRAGSDWIGVVCAYICKYMCVYTHSDLCVCIDRSE